MTDITEVHVDVVGSIGGFEIFLGHKDIEFDASENGQSTRYRQLATLLHSLAWDLEDKADAHDNFKPRCFRTELGDTWFEVVPGEFQDGATLEEATALYVSGHAPVPLESLQALYPNLQEVSF